MCRKYSKDDSHTRSFELTVDSQAQAQAQASLPPSQHTQPTAPADNDKESIFIDIKNLNEQDLKNLKEYDAFLYYSIFTAAQDAKADSNEELQVQSPHQDQDGSQSSNESNPTVTSRMIERKTRISYECHPDLLLDSLLDDEWDYIVEHEEEDCVVDPILKFVYSAMSKGSK